jgi:hypothetical protein
VRLVERLPRAAVTSIISLRPQLQISCLMAPEVKEIDISGRKHPIKLPRLIWISQLAFFHGVTEITASSQHGDVPHRYLVYAVKPGEPGKILGTPLYLGNTGEKQIGICWGINPFPEDLRAANNQYFASSFHTPVESYMEIETLSEPMQEWCLKQLHDPESRVAVTEDVKEPDKETIHKSVVGTWGSALSHASRNLKALHQGKLKEKFPRLWEKSIYVIEHIFSHIQDEKTRGTLNGKQVVDLALADLDQDGFNKLGEVIRATGSLYTTRSARHLFEYFSGVPRNHGTKRYVAYKEPNEGARDLTHDVMGEDFISFGGEVDSIYLSDAPEDIALAGAAYQSYQQLKGVDGGYYKGTGKRRAGPVPLALGKATLIDDMYRIVFIPSGEIIYARPEDVMKARPVDKIGKTYRGHTSEGSW